MPAPLDPAKREAIEQAIRDGQTRNDIARNVNVSPSTVTRIARQLEAQGEPPAFDRTQAKDAREAKLSDLADRRADMAVAAMDDAEQIRGMFFRERPTAVGKGDDARVIDLPPSARDLKDLAVAFGIMVDKSRSLVDDGDQGVETAVGAVTGLVDALRARRETRDQ